MTKDDAEMSENPGPDDAVADDAAEAQGTVEVREADSSEGEADETKSAPEDRETAGPFDSSEVPAMRPYVDLGGIKVAPREGLQLRLEVDERNDRVVAVSLEYAESLLQVQAFAAPKTTGLWHGIRAEVAQQLRAQGAEVAEEDGPLGAELFARTDVPAEQGGGVREARFIGVDGPRWILRGTILGKATQDDAARAQVIDLFRELVVVRGDQPIPPSELLQLRVPAGVQGERVDAAAEAQSV